MEGKVSGEAGFWQRCLFCSRSFSTDLIFAKLVSPGFSMDSRETLLLEEVCAVEHGPRFLAGTKSSVRKGRIENLVAESLTFHLFSSLPIKISVKYIIWNLKLGFFAFFLLY